MKRMWMLLLAVLMLCLSACGDDAPTEDNRDHSDKGSKPAFTFPVQSTQPTDPTEPTEPTDPTDPTDPTEPTEPESGIRPSNSLLREDLQDSLAAHIEKSFADTMAQTISDFSVVLSQTEARLYTASITVTAQSVYADFTWPVDVTYTKYDQGWVMTECTWGEYTYEQVRYPSEAEVQRMLNDQHLSGTQKEELLYLDGEIQYLYYSSANWSKYATGSGTSAAVWTYNAYYDQWKYSGTQSRGISATITEELMDTWELDEEYGNIIIKNVTETGFDVDISATYYSVSSQHFAFKEALISQDDGGNFSITFTNDWLSFQHGSYNLRGTAEITIILPKYTTEVCGEFCDFAIEITISNSGSPGYDTYISYVIGQESRVQFSEYSVQVQSVGGLLLENVDILVYDGNNLVDAGRTNADGTCTFQLADGKGYVIELSNVPDGYAVRDFYGFTGNSAVISLTSSVIQGENPAYHIFQLGDVMYDFSFTSSDGEMITLSEVLAEKELVVLNFWCSTSPWCIYQFEAMNSVYQNYAGNVEVLGLNSYAPDDQASVDSFEYAYNMPLSFPIGKVNNNFNPQRFINPLTGVGAEGYPTSVFIDRYGMICMITVGSITHESDWIKIFSHFVGEDYQQTILQSVEDLPDVKPDFEFPAMEDIADAINVGDIQVEYTFDPDEYAWPFLVGEKDGRPCIYASNQYICESYAILYANVTMEKGDVLAFDYFASSEEGFDLLYVIVDNEPIYTISGVKDEWASAYCWVADKPGTYELALCYLKDTDTDMGDDTCYISNLRIVTVDDIDVPSYLPCQAGKRNENGTYEYVDIYLNENDGYYHVGSPDGPLLLAGLCAYTQFDPTGVIFEWAYNGELTLNGHDYHEDFLDYCQASLNSSLSGWCTVTEELAELLKIVDKIKGYDDQDDNEWLLLCKYYDAYGTGGKQMADPVAGLQIWSALTATEGVGVQTNHFYYDGTPRLPRGKFARFTPERSGVYRITSSTDYNDILYGWIFDKDNNMLYEYTGDQPDYTDLINVCMIMYMEAGVDYYISIAPYDVYAVCNIWYDIEYYGESYELFRCCSPGPFIFVDGSMDEGSVITNGIKVVLNPEDGYYHEDLGKDAQGNQIYGSIIYAYFTGPTYCFAQSLATVNGVKGIIELGGFNFSLSAEDQEILYYLAWNNNDVDATYEYLRALWGDDYAANLKLYQVDDVLSGIYHGTGSNLEAEMLAYCDLIIESNDDLNGCVPVDARLAELLQMIMAKYTFDVEDAWQKFCFYYDTLD